MSIWALKLIKINKYIVEKYLQCQIVNFYAFFINKILRIVNTRISILTLPFVLNCLFSIFKKHRNGSYHHFVFFYLGQYFV